MSVVLGDWLSIPFATVPRNFASSFDGISLVLINHGMMLVVCTLNHLNHLLYLAKLKDIVHMGNEMEQWVTIINICIRKGEWATVECSLDLS